MLIMCGRMRGLLSPKFLLVTVLCTGIAFGMSMFCRGHAVGGAVPVAFLLALVTVTFIAGRMASLVVVLVASFIFAVCLFEPYGSLAIHSAVDRIELLCFVVAAIGMVRFSPNPEGVAKATPRRDSGHIPFLSFSGSRGSIQTSESLQTWIAVVGYAVGLMAVITLLLYMWK